MASNSDIAKNAPPATNPVDKAIILVACGHKSGSSQLEGDRLEKSVCIYKYMQNSQPTIMLHWDTRLFRGNERSLVRKDAIYSERQTILRNVMKNQW